MNEFLTRFRAGRVRQRRSLLVATLGATVALMAWAPVSFADLPGGCDFAPSGTTPNCQGPLSGTPSPAATATC